MLDGTLYGRDLTALRTERYKLILHRAAADGRALELYDWQADPRERRDLAAEQPELALQLETELEAQLAALALRAKDLRPGAVQDLSPAKKKEYEEQLDALGYGGGDEDD